MLNSNDSLFGMFSRITRPPTNSLKVTRVKYSKKKNSPSVTEENRTDSRRPSIPANQTLEEPTFHDHGRDLLRDNDHFHKTPMSVKGPLANADTS
jgi:hypothetical protein